MDNHQASPRTSFGAAAGAILARVPSGGRLACEEIAHLLALEIGAGAVVICLSTPASKRTEIAAVWAFDRYTERQLEWAAMNGGLAQILDEGGAPVMVDDTAVWHFDAGSLDASTGWAIPVNHNGLRGLVCALYDEPSPDVPAAVEAAGDLAPLLGRLI
jgi:hypothetical protein